MDGLRLSGQIMAAMLLSVFLTIGMAVIVAWHTVVSGFLSGSGSFGGFIATGTSLLWFLALLVGAYKWVQTQGFGVFAL